MEIIHLSVDTPMQVHDSVCALGFFDGVHLGHQQLLKEVEHIAKEKGLKKAIMTFSVHPKQILENNDYHYLMSLSEKINILKQWQFDYFYIIDFDQTVANLKPNTFLQNYIINHQIKHVVCGFDFVVQQREEVGGAAFPLPPLWKADDLRSGHLGLTRVTQQDTSCSAAFAAFSISRWRAAASRASFFSCSSRFFSFSRDCCAAWLAAALARFAFFLRSDSS